jgi:type VI secretion system protein ImpL
LVPPDPDRAGGDGLRRGAALAPLAGRSAADALAGTLAEASPADAEEAVLGQRMRDALAQLKSQTGGQRNYLYQRPWYVIIGPPGAGKTTALAHSGLRFPWSDTAVKGIGGTRNLDFWFADEAVFVDTAGRYTTQDPIRPPMLRAGRGCCACCDSTARSSRSMA